MTNTTTAATMTETTAYGALRVAQIHAETTKKDMRSSALLTAEDAAHCFNRGDYYGAVSASERSLRYSVGVFHADHAAIKALLG